MSTLHSNTKADFLTWEETTLLIKKLYDDEEYRMSLMVGCGFFFGLRISELLSLTWEDILQKEKIMVHDERTGNNRLVIVNAACARVLPCLLSNNRVRN